MKLSCKIGVAKKGNKMSVAIIFVSLTATLITVSYLYVKYLFSYWKRRGVPYKEASFPFGSSSDAFLSKRSFGEALEDLYNGTTEPVFGSFTTVQPVLLVRDPKIIRDILIKDFQSFNHRGWQANIDVDPMADNILLQRDEHWKHVRAQLSPAFSSGKLKAMFETFIDCGKSLDKYVDKFANTNQSIEMRELFARYSTNVIVSVAFGIEIDCIEEPDSEFRKNGQAFFEPTMKNLLRGLISLIMPKLSKLLKLRFVDKEVGDFMIDTVRQNLEYREKNNISRKDFFQLLMQLRNTGKIQDDNDWAAKATSNQKAISLEEMAAHAFFFFAAGFETTSSTMSFLMYEWAKNPDIQQKAYDEIVEVLSKHDGKLTYESVGDMKYIGQCIDGKPRLNNSYLLEFEIFNNLKYFKCSTESLRMHPPLTSIQRSCTKDYKIPDSNIVIEKGTMVMFSVSGLHYDPKYYDEPKKFKPERYSDVHKSDKSFIEMPNLAFGDGPRNCLGMRMGKLQSKIGVVLLLQKFRFELADEHKNTELKFNPVSFVLFPINGINLMAFRR